MKRNERVQIAGWVDILPSAAADAARGLDLAGIHVGTDLTEGIRAVAPDFVLNATAPSAHASVAVQALEAGLPVLCEKPMADTLEKARLMVATSERTGSLLVVSQQRRYDASLAALRGLIKEHVGPPAILNSDFYLAHPQSKFMLGMSSPLLLDMAIHTFDAARYASDTDPVSVWCEHFNPPWSWFEGNAAANAVFEMTSGLHYTYRGCWCSRGNETTWEATWRAVGPNGTAIWEGESPPQAQVAAVSDGPSGERRTVRGLPDPRMPVGLEGSLNAFLAALETGTPPMGECHDNIKSLAMVFGALESAQTGKRVSIESMLA
jgi:predicted dehydrogenase